MQRDASVCFSYSLTTTTILLLGHCWYTYAYVAAAAAGGARAGADIVSDSNALGAGLGTGTGTKAALANKHMAELMAATYPERTAAAATGYMSDMTGSIALQPPPQLVNEFNGRAAVYDPGDELLRALNAETAANGQELGTLPEEPDYADTVFNELEIANKYEMLHKLENDLREEQEIVTKSALLMKMLEDPNLQTLPVIYVEEEEDDGGLSGEDNILNNSNLAYGLGGGVAKRSRYYHRYPWKRHNRNRSTYEPELRYACTPSKEDVFKLLMNLHENRKGNHSKTVNFCNRKRPAKAIFTNIRFLG